ncbi:mandelate racemase/muconate lactonizing enzyme family protein [Sulfolobus sp. E5-1-F]|uniref:mandelate racemase/muconate lactonizing enzyme family protein n=1 Tax=Saccharolobus sp. E5-1-F TaxID=2663019 RepID=UPI001295DB57|nr:mandelate racemase/muconate lactonizing enzyme family protein [Sulfolobus sp. E5-1-F]QGA53758.1 mandelate racemase/muconate lactonizing enzyme family protein [Sulfolobus sp. E5-1-F]
MKVKPFPLSIPFNTEPPSEWKDTWDVQLYVKVEDGEDYGWGEALVAGSGIINAYLSIINDIVVPLLSRVELSEPIDVRTILEKILFSAGNCGVVSGAISAVEMALWGLKARKSNVELYRLIGSKIRDSVKVYASFPRFGRINDVVIATRKSLDRGFDLIKLHQSPLSVLDAVKAIRENYKEVKIAIDLNSPFDDLDVAKEFVDKVHKYEIEWIEEPLWPPNDYDLLSKLTEFSPIPIAAGENEYSLYGFRKLIESGITYLQPDIAKVGGVSKFLEILDLASKYKVRVLPHDRPDASPLSLIYTLNLGLVNSQIEMVEYTIADFPNDLFYSLPKFKGGYISPPENLEVVERNIEKYSYKNRLRILHFSDLENKLRGKIA